MRAKAGSGFPYSKPDPAFSGTVWSIRSPSAVPTSATVSSAGFTRAATALRASASNCLDHGLENG